MVNVLKMITYKLGGTDHMNGDKLRARERAGELLQRMTLREKVGQLNQRLYGFNIYIRKGNSFELTEEFKAEVERFGGIGTLYGLYRADPWAAKDEETGITPELAQEAYNTVQSYVVEHSRLHIPMLLSSECPHGHQALEGGLLPVNLAVGATMDPELLREATTACGRQLSSEHVDLALMSVLDVVRDPRWGRSEECYSEDPYLCAEMARAAVTGMQSAGVTAVAKHLCAQGETTGGINASAARIGRKELGEIHLPPVKAVCEAHAGGVMAAYNEIDGVLCHSNRELLTDILRGEFGFDGVVMADGCALDGLDVVTGDNVQSAALGLKAGVDISLWDCAFTRLEEAIDRGLIAMEDIDRAVMRVLTLKFERGLFDDPYMHENGLNSEDSGVAAKSLELARESLILLKNGPDPSEAPFPGVLPLAAGAHQSADDRPIRRILVTGPNADDRYRMMGDYTPPVRPEAAETVLTGMRRIAGELGIELVYAPGSGLFTEDPKLKAEAVRLADSCDACVVVLGGSSSRFENVRFDANGAALRDEGVTMDCGEGRDISEVRLCEAQTELVRALRAKSDEHRAKLISVVISGRPYGIREVAELSDAVIQSFYPGPYGGRAIAELIFGRISPSGRMPVSMAASSGNLPAYYNMSDSCRVQDYSGDKGGILYPFGYGLSYSGVNYQGCEGRDIELTPTPDGYRFTCMVTNTGDRDMVAVPMIFVHHRGTMLVQRRRELKWFRRIALAAGESRVLDELIPISALQICGNDGRYASIPGESDWYLSDGGTDRATGVVIRM